MKVVIMAGGKGSRISSVYSDIPKPMICICNKPVLEHQINCLRKQGLTDIILIIGHLGSVVKEYFRDGAEFGVHVEYIEEGSPLGTAGALFYLKDKVKEDFLLINGDLLFDVDFGAFIRKHQSKGGCATIFTHANDHPYDSAVIILDENDAVVEWLNKEDKRADYKNRVNAGLHVLSPDIFSKFGHLRKVDLDREILRPLITDGSLFAYHSPEYVKDMGTPERYAQVDRDYKNGIVSAKNLKKPQKAVFLDRDGTINEYKGFITRKEDIELISGAAEAIEIINKAGYLTIVISNQPVIARGECSFSELDEIHNKLETLLGEKGAYIDDIFICPHHPEQGFAGERKEYKIACNCRKPKPGLIFKASQKYNISLKDSFMIGDELRDVEAGLAAGCHARFISGKNKQIFTGNKGYGSLLEFVNAEIETGERKW